MVSDAMLLGSLHNYRLMFARMEARNRGEDVGDIAGDRLSLKSHAVSFISLFVFSFSTFLLFFMLIKNDGVNNRLQVQWQDGQFVVFVLQLNY